MAASEAARRQAREDLRDKIKLEKDFIRKLTKLNNQIVKKACPVRLFGEIVIGIEFPVEDIHDAVPEVFPIDKDTDFLAQIVSPK